MRIYKKDLYQFLTDCDGLSPLEVGVLTLLTDHAYRSEAPLPLGREELIKSIKLCGPYSFIAINRVLEKFFVKTISGYVYPPLEKELGRLERSRGAARRSANVRWHGDPTYAKRIDDPMRNASDSDAKRTIDGCDWHNFAMLDHRWIDKPKTLNPSSSIHPGGHTRAHAYTREAASMDGSTNSLALREIVQAHGLKITPKIEAGIDAAATEGVMPDTFERAIADAEGRPDVKTPALYALKSARQWTAQPTLEPRARIEHANGAPLTPAQHYGAKLERTARGLTTVTHDEPEIIEGAVTEVRHVAEKRRP